MARSAPRVKRDLGTFTALRQSLNIQDAECRRMGFTGAESPDSEQVALIAAISGFMERIADDDQIDSLVPAAGD